MNTIKIYLAESGRLAEIKKDFPLYQGQFQNILLNIYVPTSILSPDFTVTMGDSVVEPYTSGTAVKIGLRSMDRGGKIAVSKNYYMRYLKTLNYQGVEYALYERKLPKEFTHYEGQGANAPEMVINVVNIDIKTTSVLSLITSQVCRLDVMPSNALDKDEAIEPTELELLNASINQLNDAIIDLENLKQDKTDNGLETANKTVVGAINEVKRGTDSNKEEIDANTNAITNNTAEIEKLKNYLATGETSVGEMRGSTLPTDEQLNQFVQTVLQREKQIGDIVFFIHEIEGTDKIYKYYYTASGWQHYEMPALELASNGNAGIIEGTFGSSTNDTQVDIAGGQIKNIYVKDEKNAQRNIQEYLRSTNKAQVEGDTSITNQINDIKSGKTVVGYSKKADSDSLGRNIASTYLTAGQGVTKQGMYDYALPRTFNDILYIQSTGYGKDTPSETGYQFTVTTSGVGNFTLFDISTTTDSTFQLSSKNSCTNTLWISANNMDDPVQFRLTTSIKKQGQAEKVLSVALTDRIQMPREELKKIEIQSLFSNLKGSTVEIVQGDTIRQILEVVTVVSYSSPFYLYSNGTYASTFYLNTYAQTINIQSGMLGEFPVFKFTATRQDINNLVFTSEKPIAFTNNTLCMLEINIPTTMVDQGIPDNKSLVFTANDIDLNITTPYSLNRGVLRIQYQDLRQLTKEKRPSLDMLVYYAMARMEIRDEYYQQIVILEDDLSLVEQQNIIVGANSTAQSPYSFKVDYVDIYEPLLTQGRNFLFDLVIPEIKTLADNEFFSINLGDGNSYFYDIVNGGGEPLTIKEMRKVGRPLISGAGFRFVFNAVYGTSTDPNFSGFYLVPTNTKGDIMSLTGQQMYYLDSTNSFMNGQIVFCTESHNLYKTNTFYRYIRNDTTNKFVLLSLDIGGVYNLNTLSSVQEGATNGNIPMETLNEILSNPNSMIQLDNEYYELSAKGHMRGYTSYSTIERENNVTTVKTITITESNGSWVLNDEVIPSIKVNNIAQNTLSFTSDPQTQIDGKQPKGDYATNSALNANTTAISEIETKLSNKWNKSYTILSAVTKIQLNPNERFFGIIVLSSSYGDLVIDTNEGIKVNFGTNIGKIIMIGQNDNIFTISLIMPDRTTKYYSIDVSKYQKVELRNNDMYGVLYEFKL